MPSSSLQASSTLFWPLWAPRRHVVHMYTCRWALLYIKISPKHLLKTLIYSQFSFSSFFHTHTFIRKTLLEMKISFFLLPALSGYFACRYVLFFISVAATGCALLLSSQTHLLSCRYSACTIDYTFLFPFRLPVHNFNCFRASYRFHHYFFSYKWNSVFGMNLYLYHFNLIFKYQVI